MIGSQCEESLTAAGQGCTPNGTLAGVVEAGGGVPASTVGTPAFPVAVLRTFGGVVLRTLPSPAWLEVQAASMTINESNKVR